MDRINSDKENRAMLENAVFDFIERQPIEGHVFSLIQKESEKMTYIILDRFFTAYRINGYDRSFCITGVADDGGRYLNTYGNTLKEVYENLSGMIPAMNLSPASDGRLNYRREGMFNPEFLDFEYTFRSVVYNIDAYRSSIFEGLTEGRSAEKPLDTPDEDIDRQIRKFAEMSDSDIFVDNPRGGRYILRSPEGIEIEYAVCRDFVTIRSQLDDINGLSDKLGRDPFDVYMAVAESMPFSPVYEDGRLYYVNRYMGEDSPMRGCIMEESFDCLEAHDAYRIRILDLNS